MTTRKLCVDCDRRFAVLCGLCSKCHTRMLADIAARRRAYLEGEDVRIDAAFDRAITQAPYAFAAPDRDHGKDTGRTLLLHPRCYAECAPFYEDAKPTMRHEAERLADGRLVCDACNGDLDQPAREIRTLGEALEPADDYARPRSVA